ncbi:MAG TPA: hypothetical protein VHA56_04740 [Mucilaginibacter sp.]|nr:hypothetical protein [Mucilaginibacter sp.]
MRKLFIIGLFTTALLSVMAPAIAGNINSFAILQQTTPKTDEVKPVVTKPAGTKPAITAPSQTPVKHAAQTTQTPARYYHKPTAEDSALINDKTLSGQYKYLLTKVYHYQQPFVASLYKNMLDSMSANSRKLREAEAKLATQTKTNADLQAQITTEEQALAESKERVSDVSFLGFYIDKSVYNMVMWGLVIALGLTTFIVIYRSGSLSREARYRINLYNELEEEYKAHKVKANEKEKKLARELQTERNKVDELMGRG